MSTPHPTPTPASTPTPGHADLRDDLSTEGVSAMIKLFLQGKSMSKPEAVIAGMLKDNPVREFLLKAVGRLGAGAVATTVTALVATAIPSINKTAWHRAIEQAFTGSLFGAIDHLSERPVAEIEAALAQAAQAAQAAQTVSAGRTQQNIETEFVAMLPRGYPTRHLHAPQFRAGTIVRDGDGVEVSLCPVYNDQHRLYRGNGAMPHNALLTRDECVDLINSGQADPCTCLAELYADWSAKRVLKKAEAPKPTPDPAHPAPAAAPKVAEPRLIEAAGPNTKLVLRAHMGTSLGWFDRREADDLFGDCDRAVKSQAWLDELEVFCTQLVETGQVLGRPGATSMAAEPTTLRLTPEGAQSLMQFIDLHGPGQRDISTQGLAVLWGGQRGLRAVWRWLGKHSYVSGVLLVLSGMLLIPVVLLMVGVVMTVLGGYFLAFLTGVVCYLGGYFLGWAPETVEFYLPIGCMTIGWALLAFCIILWRLIQNTINTVIGFIPMVTPWGDWLVKHGWSVQAALGVIYVLSCILMWFGMSTLFAAIPIALGLAGISALRAAGWHQHADDLQGVTGDSVYSLSWRATISLFVAGLLGMMGVRQHLAARVPDLGKWLSDEIVETVGTLNTAFQWLSVPILASGLLIAAATFLLSRSFTKEQEDLKQMLTVMIPSGLLVIWIVFGFHLAFTGLTSWWSADDEPTAYVEYRDPSPSAHPKASSGARKPTTKPAAAKSGSERRNVLCQEGTYEQREALGCP